MTDPLLGLSVRGLKRLPLWTYRVMPQRWVRWIYRDELERGREYAERIGWTD